MSRRKKTQEEPGKGGLQGPPVHSEIEDLDQPIVRQARDDGCGERQEAEGSDTGDLHLPPARVGEQIVSYGSMREITRNGYRGENPEEEGSHVVSGDQVGGNRASGLFPKEGPDS